MGGARSTHGNCRLFFGEDYLDLLQEPCPGILPIAFHGTFRQPEHSGCLRIGQPGKESKFYQLGLRPVEGSQSLEPDISLAS
jgi:hypothetical protein